MFRKRRSSKIPTAQQKRVLRTYLQSKVSSDNIARLDHFTSFLVVSMTAIFVSFAFYYENIIENPGASIVQVYTGFVSFVISGVIWSIYKYSQFRNLIDLRMITLTLARLYLKTLYYAGIFVVVSILAGLTIILLPLEGIIAAQLLEYVLPGIAGVIGLYLGFTFSDLSGTQKDWHRILEKQGRQKLALAEDTEAESSMSRVVSFVSLSKSRIFWFIAFLSININLLFGITLNLIVPSIPFIELFGNPLLIAIIGCSLLVAIIQVYRDYWITVFDLTKSNQSTNETHE